MYQTSINRSRLQYKICPVNDIEPSQCIYTCYQTVRGWQILSRRFETAPAKTVHEYFVSRIVLCVELKDNILYFSLWIGFKQIKSILLSERWSTISFWFIWLYHSDVLLSGRWDAGNSINIMATDLKEGWSQRPYHWRKYLINMVKLRRRGSVWWQLWILFSRRSSIFCNHSSPHNERGSRTHMLFSFATIAIGPFWM